MVATRWGHSVPGRSCLICCGSSALSRSVAISVWDILPLKGACDLNTYLTVDLMSKALHRIADLCSTRSRSPAARMSSPKSYQIMTSILECTTRSRLTLQASTSLYRAGLFDLD